MIELRSNGHNKFHQHLGKATGYRPPPTLPLRVAKADNLNEEITPLLPTGIGKVYSQTISNLGHEALLRRSELPL
jgi:hypothetical protein